MFTRIVSSCLCIAFTLSVLPSVSLAEKAKPKAKADSKPKVKVNFKAAKNQALLYYRKKMIPLAKQKFDEAFSTPEGKKDFITVYYRGKIAESMLRLEIAFEMTELAVKIAPKDSKEAAQAQKLLDQLQGRFSYVSIEPAKEETNKVGRVYLETVTRIFNKQKREQFQSIRTRFRETDVTLPTKIYLPYGRYKANNVPFEIKKGSAKKPSVSLFLHIIQKEQEIDNTWLYTSIGVGAALAGGLAYFLLAPDPVEKPLLNIGIVRGSLTGK